MFTTAETADKYAQVIYQIIMEEFYLLSDCIRGRVHPPPLDRGFVRGFYKGSVGHQL